MNNRLLDKAIAEQIYGFEVEKIGPSFKCTKTTNNIIEHSLLKNYSSDISEAWALLQDAYMHNHILLDFKIEPFNIDIFISKPAPKWVSFKGLQDATLNEMPALICEACLFVNNLRLASN